MEPVIIATYRQLALECGCSTDDVLCDPDLRREYVRRCREALQGQADEKTILKLLSNLRKKSKLPRSRDLAKLAKESL